MKLIRANPKIMDYKQAQVILLNILKSGRYADEEKEALMTAVGVLDMAALGKSRWKSIIRAKKARRDKDVEW